MSAGLKNDIFHLKLATGCQETRKPGWIGNWTPANRFGSGISSYGHVEHFWWNERRVDRHEHERALGCHDTRYANRFRYTLPRGPSADPSRHLIVHSRWLAGIVLSERNAVGRLPGVLCGALSSGRGGREPRHEG